MCQLTNISSDHENLPSVPFEFYVKGMGFVGWLDAHSSLMMSSEIMMNCIALRIRNV